MRKIIGAVALTTFLSGCAELQIYDAAPAASKSDPHRINYLTFYETEPAAVVTYGGDCSVGVTIVSLPGARRYVRLKSGYGSAKLAVNFGNGGILSSVNQETDTKVPETITAVGGAVKNLGDVAVLAQQADDAKKTTCIAHTEIYKINYGAVGPQIKTFKARYLNPRTEPVNPRNQAEELIDFCTHVLHDPFPIPAPTDDVRRDMTKFCKTKIGE